MQLLKKASANKRRQKNRGKFTIMQVTSHFIIKGALGQALLVTEV